MRKRFQIVLWMLVALNAHGHEKGITDTRIRVGLETVSILYTLPDTLRDVLSAESDGQLMSDDRVRHGFTVENNSIPCALKNLDRSFLDAINATQYLFEFECPATLDHVGVTYKLFPDDSGHQNFARFEMAGRHQSFVFSPAYRRHQAPVAELRALWGQRAASERPSQDLSVMQTLQNVWQSKAYFGIGFFHILEGYDHILFLLGLVLLPFRWRSILIMTATFTIAHSLTLALAIVNNFTPPAPMIEALIAFSIVYIGLENIRYWKKRSNCPSAPEHAELTIQRVMTVFIFGLVHGFGFSYLLKEIGFENQLASALLFFNLGVEAGQLLIISLSIPLLIMLLYKKRAQVLSQSGSVGIAILGGFWMVERLL